jgi:hypothetical protein
LSFALSWSSAMALVREAYRNYKPPKWVRPTVERLLAAVPAAHLSSVQAIVLTDAASVGEGRTQRVKGRKFDRRACGGFYHPRHLGSAASIHIVVDNVVASAAVPFLLAFGPFREQMLADVLFHELGHHLDVTIGAAAPGGETAADDWSRRLSRTYFRRRYWWLRPIAQVLLPLVAWEVRRRRRVRIRPRSGDS